MLRRRIVELERRVAAIGDTLSRKRREIDDVRGAVAALTTWFIGAVAILMGERLRSEMAPILAFVVAVGVASFIAHTVTQYLRTPSR